MKNKKMLMYSLLCGSMFLGHLGTSQSLYVPNGTSGIGNSSNTDVGVNTNNPNSKLDVYDGAITITPDAFGNKQPKGTYDDNEAIRMVGDDSDYIISLQDGTGRVQQYWNAKPSTGSYLVSNEEAVKINMAPHVSTWYSLSWAEKGTAGSPINWNTHFAIRQNGNVGIGTTNPSSKLVVAGTIHSKSGGFKFPDGTIQTTAASVITSINDLSDAKAVTHSLYIGDAAGTNDVGLFHNFSVGIGGSALQDNFSGVYNTAVGESALRYNVFGDSNTAIGYDALVSTSGSNNVALGFSAGSNITTGAFNIMIGNATQAKSASSMYNLNIGNTIYGDLTPNAQMIGINTPNPDAELTVNGTIHATEVLVDLNVPGPDYVFEADYELKSLEEVENYITANKHLPEIPSAKEMEANGIDMATMNMKLLQKVEELTLYMIELKKEVATLKSEE